jgi:hypothetical protein
VSTTLTVTFGKKAPEESVTVPVISPDEPTPCAWARLVANSKHTKILASDFIGFSLRMSEDIAKLFQCESIPKPAKYLPPRAVNADLSAVSSRIKNSNGIQQNHRL